MRGSIFTETMRRNWRQILYWGLGMASLGLMIASIVPDVDALQQFVELMESLPPALLSMLGSNDMAFMATADGFIGTTLFGRAVFVFIAFAIINGLNMTANDEEQGILDVLLSLPVPRWRVLLERFAAFTLILLLVVALTFGGLWLGTRLITLEINAGRMIEASINLIPTMLVTMTITVFAATLLRRRAAAAGLAVVVVVGSYFVDFIGRSATGTLADQLRAVSYFNYYGGEAVIRDGLNIGNIALLLAVTSLLLAGSVWLFQRRDIGA